jgi:hypothetical protein
VHRCRSYRSELCQKGVGAVTRKKREPQSN